MKLTAKALAGEIVTMTEELPRNALPALMDAVAILLERRGERKILRQLPYHLERALRAHYRTTPVRLTFPGTTDHAATKELLNAVERAMREKPEFTEEEDPSLLGGVRISFLDERLDFSLATALDEARRRLTELTEA